MNHLRVLLAAMVAVVLGFAGFAAPSASATSLEDDIVTIKTRLQEYFYAQGDDIIIANGIYLAKTSEALDYVESQNEDGSWADVNYADRTSSANGATWSAYIALYRMLALTQAYCDPEHEGYQNPDVMSALENALLHWDRVNPGNTNWWETEIGESIAMGRIQIFLGDELSPEAFNVTLKHNTGKLDPVGANGIWRTTNYLYKALATGDVDMINAGFDTVVKTVTVDNSGNTNEAVQPDGSFWAHGAQLYSEGYGMVLFTYAALWADVSRGTSLAFSREHLDTIAFYIIGGTRWLIRGEIGMQYLNYRPAKTYEGVTRHSSEFIEPLARMVRSDALYSTAYQAVLDGILGNTQTNGVSGNKYFWRSEFSSHQREGYGIFTRLNSSRTVGSEYRSTWRPEVGNEIVWNAQGATVIQVDNNEYRDLGPTFDWFHYPGVTSPYFKDQSRGTTGNGGSFSGGVSDGRYGASVHSLDRASTQAKKSYFYFDDEMVALGADIRSTSASQIHTTVNQTTAKDNASVNGVPVADSTDSVLMDDVRWAYNDQVGYVFPEAGQISVSNKNQTGSWVDEDSVTRKAFSLFFNHGVAPQQDEYQYIVLPGSSPESVQAYADNPAVEILQNDENIQAVRHEGLGRIMATFYQAGVLDLGDGRTLEVNHPSLVMIDESGEVPVASVASPGKPNLVVYVTLASEQTTARGVFELGSGATLGKTTTAALSVQDTVIADCTASSQAEGAEAVLACDQNLDTEWHSAAPGTSWLMKRLESGAHVTGAVLEWGQDYATKYVLQTSVDGKTWTDQQYVQDGQGGHEEIEISPTAAQYVRVLLIEGVNPDGYSVAEFQPEVSLNLALGRSVSASGGESAGSVTDGSMDTRWKANLADNSWVQVDLGAVHPVNTVRIWWEASYASRYKVQASVNGTDWTDVYSSQVDETGGTAVHRMDVEARYIRVQTVKRSFTQYGVSIWEVEVFGDSKVADAPESSFGKENLALKRPARADSVYAGFTVSAANDGNTGTRWASARQDLPATIERWLEVDLESVRTINQAVILWEGATSNNFRIEGSLDQQSWETLATVQKTSSELNNIIDFPDVQARYVRVIGLPATKYGMSIFEFELYGGFNLGCEVEQTVLDRNSTGVLSAKITPFVQEDTFAAYALDGDVAQVVGAPRATDDGRVEFDLTTGDGGQTSFMVTHGLGDEFAWCQVVLQVDTSALLQLIEQANGLDSREYTSETWTALLAALEGAKEVISTTGSSQGLIDQRAENLETAINSLQNPEPEVVAPSAPRDVSAEATGNQVTVSWTAPEQDGGAAITEYVVQVGELSVTVPAAQLQTVVSDVPEGIHEVTVSATNSAGTSVPSAATTVEVEEDPGPVATVPSAPRMVAANADGNSVTVSWVRPESDGGALITEYQVAVGEIETVYTVEELGENLSVTIDNVPAGTHSVSVTAKNSVGTSLASEPQSVVVEDGTEAPSHAPSVPRDVQTTVDGDAVTVLWTAPESDGGAEVTAYEVQIGVINRVIPVADLAEGLETVFEGVPVGTHSVTVRAQNAAGWSPVSEAVEATVEEEPTTPATVPTSPREVLASVDGSEVTVTWQAPESNGGEEITAYEVRVGDILLTIPASELTEGLRAVISDVPAGTHSVSVVAVNSVGNSAPSSAIQVVVEDVTPPVASTPTAPREVTATVSGNQVTVSWLPPESDGGAAVTAYRIQIGSLVETVDVSARSLMLSKTFAGIEPGTYAVTVQAINSAGASEASTPIVVVVEGAGGGDGPGQGGNGEEPGQGGNGTGTGGTSGTGGSSIANSGPQAVGAVAIAGLLLLVAGAGVLALRRRDSRS